MFPLNWVQDEEPIPEQEHKLEEIAATVVAKPTAEQLMEKYERLDLKAKIAKIATIVQNSEEARENSEITLSNKELQALL